MLFVNLLYKKKKTVKILQKKDTCTTFALTKKYKLSINLMRKGMS